MLKTTGQAPGVPMRRAAGKTVLPGTEIMRSSKSPKQTCRLALR